jgi:uncharacterized protein (TIGR04141 family)
MSLVEAIVRSICTVNGSGTMSSTKGTVSARVMKMDGLFRDLLRVQIANQETALGLTGYQALVAEAAGTYSEAAHLIVYGVICTGAAAGTNRLPFFSLVTFRQAANELRALGYKCAFAWIAKPPSTITKAKRKSKVQPAIAIAA